MKEMIEGIVIDVNSGLAKVKISRHSDCSNCGLCPGEDALVLDTPATPDTKPGQKVLLEVKERNMLMAAFFVYILPLIAVTGGISLGYFFSTFFNTARVLPMTLGGLIFAVLAVLAIKRFDISLQSATDMPKIIKIIK